MVGGKFKGSGSSLWKTLRETCHHTSLQKKVKTQKKISTFVTLIMILELGIIDYHYATILHLAWIKIPHANSCFHIKLLKFGCIFITVCGLFMQHSIFHGH